MGASDIGQVSTAKNSIYFKYFYLLKNIIGILSFCYKGEVHKTKTKRSYQDQDSHQDQVVLQDQVIFQGQDNMEHPPWMQSYHGNSHHLVEIQLIS